MWREPGPVTFQQAQLHQDVVDHAQARIEQQRPHVAGDDRRHEPGHQDQGAHQAGAAHGPLQRQGDDQAQQEGVDHVEDAEVGCVAQRQPELLVVQQIDELLQADEGLAARGAQQVVFVQAEPDAGNDGVENDHRDEQKARQQHQPGPVARLGDATDPGKDVEPGGPVRAQQGKSAAPLSGCGSHRCSGPVSAVVRQWPHGEEV